MSHLGSSTIDPARGVDPRVLEERITYKAELFDWCLRKAEACLKRDALNDAMGWSECAARVFTTCCAPLVSERLERNLLSIARRLPVPVRRPKPEGPRRWLHVVDSYIHNGGHASMAKRWILSDLQNNVHSVVLPFSQGLPVAETVVEAAQQSGGKVHMPPAGSSLLACAEWLRNLAFAEADYVVLHVAEYNVVISTAFGINGGPPVMLTNHAAHVFWAGVPVVDLVVNCRGSLLERQWTEELRGIRRSATLPIPLIIRQPEEAPFTPEFRAQARRTLGIGENEVMLLSVGRDHKYNPIRGADFIQAAKSILGSCPNTRIFIVGLTGGGRWQRASEETGGRLVIPPGRQSDLSMFHAAADIYLEGFPFGSTTALLEAGSLGIPCILGPAVCPPPFTTDGVAVDDELPRPATVEAYVQTALDLVASPEKRRRDGQSLGRSIRSHHTGDGWRAYLAEVKRRLPQSHAVYPMPAPQPPPKDIEHFWETYMIRTEHNLLPFVFQTAIHYGLTPRLDARMRRAYRNAQQLRRREGRLQMIAILTVSLLLPLCPSSARAGLHNWVGSLCSPDGWLTRTVNALRHTKKRVLNIGRRPLVNPADRSLTGNA